MTKYLQPGGKKCRRLGKKVLDALQHTLVAENGAASKAEEVLAFSRVELAADVVHKVLEDLHIEREFVDRAGKSLRFSILVGCDAQAILVDITEHLFRQFLRLLLEYQLSHLPVVLPPVVQRSSLHSKAFWNNNLSEPTQLLIEPSESSYHKMAGNNNCIAVGGNYFNQVASHGQEGNRFKFTISRPAMRKISKYTMER